MGKWKRITDIEVPQGEGSFILGIAYRDGTCSVGEANVTPDGSLYWINGPRVDIEDEDEAYWKPMPEGPFHSKAKRS